MSQVNKAFEAGEGGEWKNGSEKVRGVSAVSREVTKKFIFYGEHGCFFKIPYRMSHLLVHLGWVDLSVPLSARICFG